MTDLLDEAVQAALDYHYTKPQRPGVLSFRVTWPELSKQEIADLRGEALAVARVILTAPLTYEMVNEGIASLGSDDDRSSTEEALDLYRAMAAARLAEIEGKP